MLRRSLAVALLAVALLIGWGQVLAAIRPPVPESVPSGPAAQLTAGERAVWLPATAGGLTGLARGDRVDVHAPGVATPILDDVLVLRVGGDPGGALVAAPASEVDRVFAGRSADAAGGFVFALRPPR